MSGHDMLLSVTDGIRRISTDEGSDKVDITIRKVGKAQETGRVVVPSSPGTVWSADCESFYEASADIQHLVLLAADH
jgi:hypothetical protein